MKLTQKDVLMFNSLRGSDTAKQLAEFIERLEGEICDVRNWTEKDTVESARQASRALRELRTHLNTQLGKEKSDPNEYV
jgi:hypothetical protein